MTAISCRVLYCSRDNFTPGGEICRARYSRRADATVGGNSEHTFYACNSSSICSRIFRAFPSTFQRGSRGRLPLSRSAEQRSERSTWRDLSRGSGNVNISVVSAESLQSTDAIFFPSRQSVILFLSSTATTFRPAPLNRRVIQTDLFE